MQVGFPRLISAAYAISALFPDFGGFHHHSVTMQEKASRSDRCTQGCAFLRTSDRSCDCDQEEEAPRIGMEKWGRILFLVDFSPPTLLVPLAFLAQVLVRAGTPGWIGSAVEEALRSVS